MIKKIEFAKFQSSGSKNLFYPPEVGNNQLILKYQY